MDKIKCRIHKRYLNEGRNNFACKNVRKKCFKKNQNSGTLALDKLRLLFEKL